MPTSLLDLPGITFSRASAATARKADGTLQTFSSGQPAQTDSALWTAGAITNLVPYSEQIDQWSGGVGAVIAANAATAPNGEMIADRVVHNNGVANVQIYRAATVALGVSSVAIFAKADGLRYLQLDDAAGTGKMRVLFDLVAGTVVSTTLGTSAAIAPYADGWYRLSADSVTHAAGTLFATVLSPDVGDGAKAYYVWGGQVTDGSGLKDYVPTGVTPATRLADVVRLERAGPPVGTLYLEFIPGTRETAGMVYDDGNNQPFYLVTQTGGPSILRSAWDGVEMPAPGLVRDFQTNKAALSFNGRRRSLCLNGGAVASDDNVVTGWNGFNIGGAASYAPYAGGIVSLLWKSAPTGDAQLQQLTRI